MELTKETILIVDDSRFHRTVIKELFSEHFHLLEAVSGLECMRIIEENAENIDLILLDLVMPGIDGFEILRLRQEMQGFLDIPIIVLTTSDTHEIQAKTYELGANDFLVKPIDKETALSRIRNLLKSQQRIKSLIDKYVKFRIKAELDEMTGLFNKATTIRHVTNILSRHPGEQHALMVFDIDNFKAINDVYGHTVGDHTISIISSLIASQFSGSEIVGRIGGDEFVVFSQNVSSQTELYCKIDELLSIIAVKENLSIPDNVTISIGLAFSDPQDTHYDTLFAKADEALYESKHAGKGCCREYGISDTSQNEQERIVLVMTGSRNILSMLDFASGPSVKIRQVYCYDDLLDAFSGSISTLSGLYLDISEEEDHGLELLEFVEKLPLGTTPVVAICREGCMEQIRFAASHAFISDLLFTPLEATLLKRRIAAHEKQAQKF